MYEFQTKFGLEIYILCEKIDHLIMEADARRVCYDERVVKNAAASIIFYSPAVLQVAVTEMIQDDTKTFSDIFDHVKDTCRRFDQLPSRKKKTDISSGH